MKSSIIKIADPTSSLTETIGAHFSSGLFPSQRCSRFFERGCTLVILIACFLWQTTSVGQAATASVRSDGVILINGQPSFLFGFYHVSDAKTAGTGDTTRTVDLVNIAAGGFNLMHPVIDAPDINTTLLLSNASSAGLNIIAQIWWTTTNQSYRQTLVSGNSGTPAVVGWNVGDDVNYPPSNPNYSPSALKARSSEIHGYAPNQLTFGAFLTDPQALKGAIYPLASYAGAVDVVGIEDYPIDGGNATQAEELEYSASTIKDAQAAFHGTKTTYINIPQTFAWSARWPTNADSRNMLYVSFIYGARGALCYPYFDGDGLLPTRNPGLWAYFRNTLSPEVAKLRTVLSTGTLSTITGLPAYLHAGIWTLPGQIYVIVANTNRTTPISAKIPLPTAASGPATSVFASEPSGLMFSSGQLIGTVQPTDVHVYVLNTAAPIATPSPSATPTASPSPTSTASPSATPTPIPTQANSVTCADVADATIQEGSNANTNFGTATTLVVKSTYTGTDSHAFLKFDISHVTSVQKATLVFTAKLSSAGSVVTNICAEPNNTWQESTITWNTAPAPGTVLYPATVTGTQATFQVDVTNFVKAQQAAGQTTVSFAMSNPSASTPVTQVYSRQSTLKPTLVVTP